MVFYTSFCEKRPVRLSEKTRIFAYESLYEHKYGLDSLKMPFVAMDGIKGYNEMSDIDKYDAMIYEIVTKAPIRICKDEKLSGAATLGGAISGVVPASYNNAAVFPSISHLTLNFFKVLKIGIKGIKREAEEALLKQTTPEKKRFTQSCIHCLNCFEIWHKRYLDALKSLDGYEDNYKNLMNVPMNPPANFHEAVQSIWFIFAFARLCGNWPGIGRIDHMLGGYLKKDLKENKITLSEAREILAHFFIKGCEWITGESPFSGGDAQHYQNIVLAGIDENGVEITNEVTYLILEIIEELGISDFPTTVRINKKTDSKLINRVAEGMRYGNGILAVYNEDLILKSLTDYGYFEAEAKNFANDGCWEIQIPGKTNFTYSPLDSLAILQHITLKDYTCKAEFSSFEELYTQYKKDLIQQIEQIHMNLLGIFEPAGENSDELKWKATIPCTIVSLFEEDCINRGLSYLEGGCIYNVISPHIGGVADTVNSLYIIKKLVFDEQKISLEDFLKVLHSDWSEDDILRRHILTRYDYYGNDNDEVDLLAVRLLDDFADACSALEGRCPIKFPPGVSTFGRQIEWANSRTAGIHGRKKGEVLAGNLSPTPGTATRGATAIIKSHCKADLSRQTTGAALDIRLLPSDVKGADGINAISSLIKGFVALGGFFMQIDVADAEILKDAQQHPENYPSLAVRISGWNARFVTLSKEWQDMVIKNITGEI